jgi:hypothetical protein
VDGKGNIRGLPVEGERSEMGGHRGPSGSLWECLRCFVPFQGTWDDYDYSVTVAESVTEVLLRILVKQDNQEIFWIYTQFQGHL